MTTYKIKFVNDKELVIEADEVYYPQSRIISFLQDLGDYKKTVAEVSIYNMLYYQEAGP